MIVRTEDQARRLIERLQNAPAVGFDTEYSGPLIPRKKGAGKPLVDPVRCRLTSASLAFYDGLETVTAYLPLAHKGENLPEAEFRRVLAAARDRPSIYVHGCKADLLALGRWDAAAASLWEMRLGTGLRDGSVMAWQMDSNRGKKGFGLKKLRQTVLGMGARPDYETTAKGRAMEELTAEEAAQYAELDALDELELCERLWADMDDRQRKYHDELEMPLAGVLTRIARRGIACDRSYLERLRDTLAPKRAQVETDFLFWTGARMSSRREVGAWAFDGRWPKHIQVMCKDGYAEVNGDTISAALAACAPGSDGHRAASMLRQRAEYHKMAATYCEGMLRHLEVSEDGRLHPTLGVIDFQGNAPRTGRFACSAPNLQNLPKPDEDAPEDDAAFIIRSAFRPGPGLEITEADYSQVELHVLAHLMNGEGALSDDIRAGRDLHKAMGDRCGVSRYDGKHLNFAVIFRVGPRTFSLRTGKPVHECKAMLEMLRERNPDVEAYYERAARIATERGDIRTMTGRRRSVPELRSDDKPMRWRGERIAGNTPVQGGARDVVAMAMVKVDRALETSGLKARLVMQVHDSILPEHPAEERAQVQELLRDCMLTAHPGLKVPLRMDMGSGESWGDIT